MRHILIAAASFAIVTAVAPLAAHVAYGQSAYPIKNIRVIVPSPTGGPSDIVARLLGDKLAQSLGKLVVIDNRTGASQIIGSNLVAKAEPDGYALLMVQISGGLPGMTEVVYKGSTPEAFGQFLISEIARWRALLAKKP